MWCATKKPIVTRVSDASMTPSLQTTPTVVVPFRVRLFGMFDIFVFLPILFVMFVCAKLVGNSECCIFLLPR